MEKIILRNLPGVDEVEVRYANYHRLMKDEIATLKKDIDTVSMQLFGVVMSDLLFYPGAGPGDFDEAKQDEWSRQFDFLEYEYDEDAAFWDAFGIDVSDGYGKQLICLDVFGPQLVCALKRNHPIARLKFRNDAPMTEEQAESEAKAWGEALLRKRK